MKRRYTIETLATGQTNLVVLPSTLTRLPRPQGLPAPRGDGQATRRRHRLGAGTDKAAAVNVIFRGVPVGDMELALKAVRWLIAQPDTQRQAVLGYGPIPCRDNLVTEKHFYVKRNKASITVRPC